jgi:hypothetical protein
LAALFLQPLSLENIICTHFFAKRRHFLNPKQSACGVFAVFGQIQGKRRCSLKVVFSILKKTIYCKKKRFKAPCHCQGACAAGFLGNHEARGGIP